MIKRILVSLVLAVAAVAALPAPAVHAAGPNTQFAACSAGLVNFLGFEAWDGCLKSKYGGVTKIGELNDIWLIAMPLIDDAVKAAGYVALGFVIWAGIKYLKSQGDPGELNTARMTLHNALLGLMLCVLSVAIVQFVANGIK